LLIAFELVEPAPGRALLRVDARWSEAPLRGRPVLVIDDGARRHRQEAMLAPPRPPGVIRAAYQTHSDLIGDGTSFMLDLGEGTVLALPAPSLWRRTQSPAPVAAAAATTPVTPPQDLAGGDLDAMRQAAEIELLREALIEHADAYARVAAAESQLHSEQERADALRTQAQELQGRAQKLETQAQDLHAAIAALTELHEQEGVQANVLADVVRAETERREQSESRAQTLQARVASLENRLEQLVGELALVGAAREDAEQTAAELLAAATRTSRGPR
jgi:hypothetical protein